MQPSPLSISRTGFGLDFDGRGSRLPSNRNSECILSGWILHRQVREEFTYKRTEREARLLAAAFLPPVIPALLSGGTSLSQEAPEVRSDAPRSMRPSLPVAATTVKAKGLLVTAPVLEFLRKEACVITE